MPIYVNPDNPLEFETFLRKCHKQIEKEYLRGYAI